MSMTEQQAAYDRVNLLNLPINMQKKIFPEPMSGCWIWTGYTSEEGYGQFGHNGKIKQAHRAVFEEIFGDIPNELHACHHCDNRQCVNPHHIFIGTRSDNMRDASKKKRLACQIDPNNAPSGEKHGCSKLKMEQVIRMRESLLPSSYFANEYNVHISTIRRARSGERWKVK